MSRLQGTREVICFNENQDLFDTVSNKPMIEYLRRLSAASSYDAKVRIEIQQNQLIVQIDPKSATRNQHGKFKIDNDGIYKWQRPEPAEDWVKVDL